MLQRLVMRLFVVTLLLLPPVAAQAHFLWLVETVDDGKRQLHVRFSETPEPGEPDLLKRLTGLNVQGLGTQGKPQLVSLSKSDKSLSATLGAGSAAGVYVASHEWGIVTRGGEPFLLRYFAKAGPELDAAVWQSVDSGKQLQLDIIPIRVGNDLQVTVTWRGAPLPKAQIIVAGAGVEEVEAQTDSKGQVRLAIGKSGAYWIRARHIEDRGGKRGDDPFAATRYYSTLTFQVAQGSSNGVAVSNPYPPIPEMVTSFGAAVADDAIYVYGGHTGGAHAYSEEDQARTLRRLDLNDPSRWESLGTGPGLQGLAMVAHRGKLYRIGGFTAKNKDGEEHDLWSRDGVASYDPKTAKWSDLTPLPEPRSSFDAAVLDDSIYVVGGWQMAGEKDAVWHETAYALDLTDEVLRWKEIPQPPFKRRALSAAAYNGKLYAIGGMRAEGGPTTRTDIYDPSTRRWSRGPDLQGKPMDGFGSSAFAVGGKLYVTSYSGKLQQLSADGGSWKVVTDLQRARFFHRMLPLAESRLVSLGGASMTEGKFEEVDVLDVSSQAARVEKNQVYREP